MQYYRALVTPRAMAPVRRLLTAMAPARRLLVRGVSSITGTLKWDPRVGTFAPGVYAELRHVVSAGDVSTYAGLLGDTNPVHTDAAFAATTPFKRPIAHGMLSAGLIPTIFGATVPGCIYVSQSLRFVRPVFVGDAVVARVTVRSVRLAALPRGGGALQPYVTCDTVVTVEGSGKVAIDGEAVVLLPPLPAGSAAA